MSILRSVLRAVASGRRLEADEVLEQLESAPLEVLLPAAENATRAGFGTAVTYSRKVFIPLTRLCRDVCHYCTFAKTPRRIAEPYLSIEQVLAIARAGEAAGCKEALFTLGDRPEARYAAARSGLEALGATSTLDYVRMAASSVLRDTTLLPHLNPGLMEAADFTALRPVAASMGMMLETASARLSGRGGPHFGSPDKRPERRLAALRAAGEARVAITTGLLIGIGETRRERLEALLELRRLHRQYGHLQELIIQNFRAKPGTKMANAPEPSLDEQLWSIAVARLVFGPSMSIQAPPNLRVGADAWRQLLAAGVNDWGGVSPVTMDHVNPEAPWPHLAELEACTARAGRTLVERLALCPGFARQPEKWTDPIVATRVRRMSDMHGWARTDGWCAGGNQALPARLRVNAACQATPVIHADRIGAALACACRGEEIDERAVTSLFAAQGPELIRVLDAADRLRAETVGEPVGYVVNRNINYTNICTLHCGFCAFAKGRGAATLRGPAYNLSLEEIAARTVEAHARGATEVCLQGGIHPSFTGNTYLEIVRVVKQAVPSMHVHAFSPLEVSHGARSLDLSPIRFLEQLRDAGLSTLPGTAAEILDDEVRARICPDKLRTEEWLEVLAAAHAVGLRTTATIMFGHIESPEHCARHLLHVRRLQARTGGITEFVPLPYVHMEAPMGRRGLTRSGPTWREVLLMHAIARLVLHPLIPNIQASWVKLGPDGVAACLRAGANDVGGTLMDESITRSAGGVNGQCLDADELVAIAALAGRPAYQRTTLYLPVNCETHRAANRLQGVG